MTNREKLLEMYAKENPALAKKHGRMTNEELSRYLFDNVSDRKELCNKICKEFCERAGACPIRDPAECVAIWFGRECEE